MKLSRKILAIAGMLLAFTFEAQAACSQQNNVFGLVGLGEGGIIYAGVSDSDGACGCTNFRFNPTNTDVDKALSILLSAKLSGTPARVDIEVPGNCSTAHRVYLQ